MKRLICILILMILLCACGTDKVPVYESQETQTTSALTEAVPLSMGKTELPDGEEMYHLSDAKNNANAQYRLERYLHRYNETLDLWESCCVDADCAHADESCTAWFGSEDLYRRFAVVNGICYCAEGELGKYALRTLEVYALNPATGERRSYFRAEAQGEKEIYLGNVAISGQTAILNYSTLDIDELTKMQYILAIDLRNGTTIRIMEREISNGEVYELWGMNETHIVVSYFHSGGNQSFANTENAAMGLPDHTSYIMDQHRWVLLEFPIEENAKWSEQIAQYMGSSNLRLFNHGNFYNGTLFYALNEKIWAYNLKEHKNTPLFEEENLQYMSCLDGKILYLTGENECFSYDLQSGKTTQLADTEYFPIAETENGFYCKKIKFTASYLNYFISKADFYAGRFDTIIASYY